MRLLLFLTVSAALLLPLSAQQRPGSGGAEAAVPRLRETSSNLGIHFVSRQSLPLKVIYLQMDEKNFKKMSVPTSQPGLRAPFPKGGVIRIYDKIPEKGENLQPLLDSKIPDGMGTKILGILGVSGGKLNITYIDETELKPNLILIKNLTRNTYLFDVKDDAGSEKKRFELKEGGSYIFGKSFTTGGPAKGFNTALMRQYPTKTGEMRWFQDRMIQLNSRPSSSGIILLMADEQGKRMIFCDITLYED